MLKGLANLGNLLRQAQQMGGRMQEIAERLKARRVHGSAGGGMVQVEANGLGEILRVTIDADLVARNEREMIEDLVPAAVNQALRNAKELHAEAVRSLTAGIQLPGLEEALSQMTGNLRARILGRGTADRRCSDGPSDRVRHAPDRRVREAARNRPQIGGTAGLSRVADQSGRGTGTGRRDPQRQAERALLPDLLSLGRRRGVRNLSAIRSATDLCCASWNSRAI